MIIEVESQHNDSSMTGHPKMKQVVSLKIKKWMI